MTGRYICYKDYATTAKYLQYPVDCLNTNIETPNDITKAAIMETIIDADTLPAYDNVETLLADLAKDNGGTA
jgi:ABC-type uncharacterized transport system YnjBCD substrate-binding protein